MYEIESERVTELDHAYLVLRNLPEEKSFEEEMLSHNVIPGVLPMQTMRVCGECLRRYPVDGCLSLAESLLGQKLSGAELRRILSSLFERIGESKKYLLREESFVLQPTCIFLRHDTGEVELIYCPEYEQPLPSQMRGLSDWLLGYLDPQDAQAVYSGYAFHVLSHEDGNTVQKMLTAVEREPDRMQGTSSYQLPGEPGTYVEESGEYAAGVMCQEERGRKRRGLRGIFSFFSGISVVTVLICALLWAMS